jgi:hypothetical protein
MATPKRTDSKPPKRDSLGNNHGLQKQKDANQEGAGRPRQAPKGPVRGATESGN